MIPFPAPPRRLAFLLLLHVGIAACASPAVTLPASRSAPVEPGPLRGGAAQVDITPPAGLALFGHGPHARVASGHRGRLRCQALVLEGGDRLALVTCDLSSISMLLHRQVAARTASVGIGADRLVLSATHTHAGYAHYYGSAAYNSPVSSQRWGFDPQVLTWTADRIAHAVRRAARRAREGAPVAVRWGHEHLEEHLTTNRSVCAHCRNANPMVDGPSTCPAPPRPLPPGDRQPLACTEGAAIDVHREVDRTLSVLRVDRLTRRGPRPIALYAVFPVHATAVAAHNTLYHADLFGFASRYAQARLAPRAAPDEPAVVLFANSHEGDVSPEARPKGFRAARRLGLQLGRAMVKLHGRLGTDMQTPRVAVAYGEAPLPGAPIAAADGNPPGALCSKAELGTAAFGGAEDGRTFMHALPTMREGMGTRRWTDHCQSPKRPAGFGISRLATDEWSLPTVAPLHVARIGDTLLAALPAELTTTAGLRLRRALRRRGGAAHVAIVGLANGYMQYVTTAAEYSAQHYEGASTLYGPHSWSFFADRLRQLAGALSGEPLGPGWELDRAPPRRAHPGAARPRWPRPSRAAPAPRIVDRHLTRTRCGARLSVSWRGPAPGALEVAGAPVVSVHHRTAEGGWAPLRTDLGFPVDDRDPTVMVEGRPVTAPDASDPTVRTPRGGWVWIATWTPDHPVPAGTYRYRIRTGAGALVSERWTWTDPLQVDCWSP